MERDILKIVHWKFLPVPEMSHRRSGSSTLCTTNLIPKSKSSETAILLVYAQES